MESTYPNFAGKVVQCGVEGAVWDFTALEDPSFENQGGRLFLVGSSPKTGDDDEWAGVPMCVSWDHVTWYAIHESVEAFLQRPMLPQEDG